VNGRYEKIDDKMWGGEKNINVHFVISSSSSAAWALHALLICYTIYDTIEEFIVDSKAEYKLNLAHVGWPESKTNKASAPLIQDRLRSTKDVRSTQKQVSMSVRT